MQKGRVAGAMRPLSFKVPGAGFYSVKCLTVPSFITDMYSLDVCPSRFFLPER